jgi:3-hydroxyacyl-[acyl-carrier-protein] dehydratase
MVLDPGGGPDHFAVSLLLPVDFAGFEGHFPGEPVLPGVCVVQAVLVACAERFGRNVQLRRLDSAKFTSPVRPGERLELRLRASQAEAGVRVRAEIAVSGRKAGQFLLVLSLEGTPCAGRSD